MHDTRSNRVDRNRIPMISVVALSPVAEYTYYALILYAIMAPTWGISIPLVGAGAMALLAAYCLLRTPASLFAPLVLPIGCALSFLAIQLVVHNLSLTAEASRIFVNWVLTLIVVQSLLARDGFFHRFSLVVLGIGFLLLPYLNFTYIGGDEFQRAGLEHDVGFANPNQLAAWFGFGCVYLIVLASKTKRNAARIVSSLTAFGCLAIVGLTVSRGALMAIAIAVVFRFRESLRRAFVPLLLLIILGGGAFLSGLFDQAIGFYSARGTEDTGRLAVWPLALQRFLDTPLVGVGGDDDAISTYVPGRATAITPHNSFLYIGLASGIIPLMFYVTYWIKALISAHQLSRKGLQDAPFQIPLVIYTFILVSLGANDFMFPFAVVTLCNAMARPLIYQIRGVSLNKRMAGRASSAHRDFRPQGFKTIS